MQGFNDIENVPEDVINNPGFSDDNEIEKIIKVIGVGGGGNNAINHMYAQNIKGVSFVVCNTDRQALNGSQVPSKVLIGPNTTHGLGAGNKPEVAKAAAEESAEEIAKLFQDDTKMVFITAGMGGGTGTGAAPVVARIAREHNILTVGIVTIPFLFEGEKKIIKALNGAEEMSKYVDALLVINNERLTEIYGELDFLEGFGKADDTLSTAARSISEIITTQGKINLDFNDVRTTLLDGGVAIISSGYGEGERRMTKAIEEALKSPLLRNRDVYGSKRILVNIYFSTKAEHRFVMSEVDEMREFMCKFTHGIDVIWGVATDDTLGNKVKVTILASGFNVSLTEEVESKQPQTTKPKTFSAPAKPSEPDPEKDQDRIFEIYGPEALQNTARAKYMVLSLDEYDNDEVVDMIERTPTFRRDSKFKDSVKEIINAPQKQEDATEPQIEQKQVKKTINFAD